MNFDHRGASSGTRSKGRLASGLILIAGLVLMPAALHAQADNFEAPPAPADDILEPADPGWNSVSNLTTDSDGPVLELPQAVAADDGASVSSAAADPMGDPDPTIAPDTTVAEDQSGDLGGFEGRQANGNQFAAVPMFRPVQPFPRFNPTYNPSWRFVPQPPPTIIVIRPSGLSPLPATSPMLTTPRGSGPVWGGWWHRIH
jgi:hypothetical protein